MNLAEIFGPGPYVIVGFVVHGAEQLLRLEMSDDGAAQECVEMLKVQTQRTVMTDSAMRAIEHGEETVAAVARVLSDGRRMLIAPPEFWEHILTLMERTSRTDACPTCRSFVEGIGAMWPLEEYTPEPGMSALRFHKCAT